MDKRTERNGKSISRYHSMLTRDKNEHTDKRALFDKCCFEFRSRDNIVKNIMTT